MVYARYWHHFSVSFVKCEVPFLLASLATLRKYSSFLIVKAIIEEKLKKKNMEKKYKEKGTILKVQEEEKK